MATVGLTFSPSPASVRTARLLATALGRRSGLPDDLIDEVRLAVDETCSRAVAVHQRLASDEPVQVSFVEDNRGYQIAVFDVGPAAEVQTADLAADFGGGVDSEDLFTDESSLGPSVALAVVTGLVDDVVIKPSPSGGTVVVLRWRR